MQESSSKPRVFYVLGGPGSGKGTQCDLIMSKYHYAKFKHISTGKLLRDACQADTPENRDVIRTMKEGKMVASKPLVRLIKAYIEQNGNEYIYMLDGIFALIQVSLAIRTIFRPGQRLLGMHSM